MTIEETPAYESAITPGVFVEVESNSQTTAITIYEEGVDEFAQINISRDDALALAWSIIQEGDDD